MSTQRNDESVSNPERVSQHIEDRLDYWFDRLTAHLDSAGGELDADRERYRTRELASGDYVLRTPGQTYILETRSVRGPHAKSKPDEAYTEDDRLLERVIEQEVDRMYANL